MADLEALKEEKIETRTFQSSNWEIEVQKSKAMESFLREANFAKKMGLD